MPAPLTQTTGRRKQAVARVRFRPGQGAIRVNKQPIEAYFTSATHRMLVTEPLRLTEKTEAWDIDVTIDGGGVSGQAGAFRCVCCVESGCAQTSGSDSFGFS